MNVEITTASKSRERQSDAPAIVEVLTRDELARFGGTTLEDVLTRVPGLGGQSAERAIVGARPGQSATDTVPFNKGRATYLGLKVGF